MKNSLYALAALLLLCSCQPAESSSIRPVLEVLLNE